MNEQQAKDAINKAGNRTLPLKYVVGIVLVVALILIAAFGGIKGCALQKPAPAAESVQ